MCGVYVYGCGRHGKSMCVSEKENVIKDHRIVLANQMGICIHTHTYTFLKFKSNIYSL